MSSRFFSLLFFVVPFLFSLTGCGEQAAPPDAITAKFNPLTQTNYNDETKKVYPLTIQFSGSAALIEQLQKELSDGVSIEPAIKGRWRWENDHTLTFTPQDDWAAGQQYKVKLDKKILNPKLSYAKSVTEQQTLRAPLFTASIVDNEFYQDPNQSHIRYALTQVKFSHPVEPAEFERTVTAGLIRKNIDGTQDVIAPLGVKVRYDEKRLNAWISSDSVSLANSDNQYIQTKIDKKLTALSGVNGLENDLIADVSVPTKYSLDFSYSIDYINNNRDEAEQILFLNFNNAVKGADVVKNLKAFLLPEKDDSWSYNRITQEVLNKSKNVALTLLPTENIYEKSQKFRLDIPENRCIYLYADTHFSALGGYQFGKPMGMVTCVGNYPRHVAFVGEGSLLNLKGEKKLTIASRNFDKIKLDIGRIQPQQLRHIANLNEESFQKPILGNLKFDDIADFHSVVFNVPNHNPSKAQYTGVDLTQRGNLPAEKGIFWLKATGYKKDQKIDRTSENLDTSGDNYWYSGAEQSEDYRLVILTDLGIIAKKALDGSQSVFVQSIHSGEPIAGAQIKVISRNGSTLEQHLTDAQGVALLPNLANYVQEQEPVMYLVEHDGDQSFLPIDKEDRVLNYSRFDTGGRVAEADNTALKSHIITDRGIYRPGEMLHTAIITKPADWNVKLSNIPLQVEISTPSGQVAHKDTIRLAQNGLNSLNYSLPANAETGQWWIRLFTAKEDEVSNDFGSTAFQVQEFQPDSLKIKTQFNARENLGWVSPNDLTADVYLTNLFGTPAQKRRVTANLTLYSLFPKFAQYEDYQFYDNQRNKSAILYELELNEQYTDDKGEAKFALDLSQYAENTVQMLYFTADGFETDSGRGVSKTQSVMVSAQPWLVGYHAKQDLNYLKQNATAAVDLIAINPNLEKIAVKGLTATLFERKYVSVLTQQTSGAYKYESKLVENQKAESAVDISSEISTLPLDTSVSGDFVLVLSNENKQEVNRINYSVIGNQNVSTEMAKNTELKLKLNKKQFQPNEEIEVVINAPYTGNGLITIERDRVYTYKWFKADTTQSVQRIRIPSDFEGNGYVNVQFSRDIHSAEIFTSPLSYAVVPFSVNVDNRRLNLTLNAPKQVKSGETVEFKLTSDKPTKAIIYAVNEGILQVANYQFTDPLKFFFPKYALQVDTLQILDLILPEFNNIMQYAQMGGDAEAAMELRARAPENNPFKRKADKPVAYWSDIVSVDGEKTVIYQIPEEFNGNLKVMAIAVSDDGNQIGTAQTDTLVRNDVIISPNAPLTLTPNDESQIAVSVANNTDISQQIKVNMTADEQIVLIGEAEKIVEIPPMSESAVSFGVKASEQVGAANVRITAHYQNAQQQPAQVDRSISISVRPIQPKQHFTRIGKVEAGKQINIDLPASLYPQQRTQSALFSPAPLALTQGISVYLANYDNYCTEQVISSAMPNILVAGNPEYQKILTALSRGNDKTDPLIATKALKKVFEILPSRQTESGEFGVWNNVEDTDLFVTAYVAHFLIEAQDHQMHLPRAWMKDQGLLPKTIAALEYQSQPQDGDSLLMLRQRAYSAYLLTRLAQVPSNALMSIRTQLEQNFKPTDWQKDLTAAWLAAAYQNLKQQELADKLIAPVLETLDKPRSTEWRYEYYYDPLIQDASALYIVARHFPEHLAAKAEPVLNRITEDLNGERYNTLSSAMILLALDAYAQHHQAEAEKLQITLDGSMLGELQGAFRFVDIAQQKATLAFSNQSQQPAWFAVSQSGYPQQAPQNVVKNGLEIDRTYTDKDGKPVQTVKIGDVINVTLNLRSTKGYLTDVVTTDLFPAGFEAIWNTTEQDDENAIERGIWRPAHTELREDRMIGYGSLDDSVLTLKYRLKAVNQGTFQIPAVYAESMYDRSIKALSIYKGSIKVEK